MSKHVCFTCKHLTIVHSVLSSCAGRERNFQKVQTNNLNTPYDYDSVMHYGRWVKTWRGVSTKRGTSETEALFFMTANDPHNVCACTTKLFSTARLCLDPDTPSPSTANRPSLQRMTLTASSGPPKWWVPMTSPASTSSTNAVSVNLMLYHIYARFCCKTHSSAGEITII